MIHLKRFNESLRPSEIQELQEFCETSLAYLLDEGFEILLESSRNDGIMTNANSYILSLCFPNSEEDFYVFDWNYIKNYFIPFLQLLSRRYELGFFSEDKNNDVWFIGDQYRYATLEQVISDNLASEIYLGLWSIKIRVKCKIEDKI